MRAFKQHGRWKGIIVIITAMKVVHQISWFFSTKSTDSYSRKAFCPVWELNPSHHPSLFSLFAWFRLQINRSASLFACLLYLLLLLLGAVLLVRSWTPLSFLCLYAVLEQPFSITTVLCIPIMQTIKTIYLRKPVFGHDMTVSRRGT